MIEIEQYCDKTNIGQSDSNKIPERTINYQQTKKKREIKRGSLKFCNVLYININKICFCL